MAGKDAHSGREEGGKPLEARNPSSEAVASGVVDEKEKDGDPTSDFHHSDGSEESVESSDDDHLQEKKEASCLKDSGASFQKNDKKKWQLRTHVVTLLAHDQRRGARFDKTHMKEPKNLEWLGIKPSHDPKEGEPWVYKPRYYVLVPDGDGGEYTEVGLKADGSTANVWVSLEEAEAMRQRHKEYMEATKKPANAKRTPVPKVVSSPPVTKRARTSGVEKTGARGVAKAKDGYEIVKSRGKAGKKDSRGAGKQDSSEGASGALALKSTLAKLFGGKAGGTEKEDDGGVQDEFSLDDFFGGIDDEVQSEGAKLLMETYPGVFTAEAPSVVESVARVGTDDAIKSLCEKAREEMIFKAAVCKKISPFEVIRQALLGQSGKRKAENGGSGRMSPPWAGVKSERGGGDTTSVASSHSTLSSPVLGVGGLGREAGGRDHYFKTSLRVITTLFPIETHEPAHGLTLLRVKLGDKDPLVNVGVDPIQLLQEEGNVDGGARTVLGITLCYLQGEVKESEQAVLQFARGLFQAWGKSPVGRTRKDMVDWFLALNVGEVMKLGDLARKYVMDSPAYKEIKRTLVDATYAFLKNWTSGKDTSHFEGLRHQGFKYAVAKHSQLYAAGTERADLEREVIAAAKAEPLVHYADLATKTFMSDIAAMRHMHLFEDITEEDMEEKLLGRKNDVALVEYKLCKLLNETKNFSLDSADRPMVSGVKAAFAVAVEEAFNFLINPLLEKGLEVPEEVPETLGAIEEMKRASTPADDGQASGAASVSKIGGKKARAKRGAKQAVLQKMEKAYVDAWYASAWVQEYQAFEWGGGLADINRAMEPWRANFALQDHCFKSRVLQKHIKRRKV